MESKLSDFYGQDIITNISIYIKLDSLAGFILPTYRVYDFLSACFINFLIDFVILVNLSHESVLIIMPNIFASSFAFCIRLYLFYMKELIWVEINL